MKHTKKRVAALLLALAMVLSLMPMAFAADEFPDMPAEDDPSYAAVKSAVDNGIMTGDNGMLNLEGTILRSTVSKMVAVAFAAKGEADLGDYPDVEEGKWYTEWMAKANQMGIMTGSNGNMEPSREVTMAEVAVMLARALGLPVDSSAAIDGVAAWAAPAIKALIDAGYISSADGAHLPMNRAAFAEVIYNVSGKGNYVSEGEITTDVDGNIIITSGNVSLKGITVTGDVIIADGVDAGSIVLDGVTVEGRVVVRGAAETRLANGAKAAATVVAVPAGETAVVADVTSDAGDITVAGTHGKVADKVVLDMAAPKVAVNAATEVAVKNANGGEVALNAPASLSVESGKLENVTVAVDGAAVDVAAGATIEMVTTNTDLTVTGQGKVEGKEGSGSVTDGSGNEVGGSDEPADIIVPNLPSNAFVPAAAPGAKPEQVADPSDDDDWEAEITVTGGDLTEEHVSHSFTANASKGKAATCTEEGYDCAECECGAVRRTTTQKIAHTATDVDADIITVPANCKGPGYTSKPCSVCGTANVYVTEIAQVGHSAGDNPTYVTRTVDGAQKHFARCQWCAAEIGDGTACDFAAECSYGKTAAGHSAPCGTCGKVLTKAHDEDGAEQGAVAATCTIPGKAAAKVCNVCGYVHPAETTAALGHSWVKDEREADPTEENPRVSQSQHCDRDGCGATRTEYKYFTPSTGPAPAPSGSPEPNPDPSESGGPGDPVVNDT